MKEVLEETNGIMVYQEQVMRILNRLGGIELSNAYTCIKAISKKKLELIAKYREQFVAGSVAQGLSQPEATELFGLIEFFAGYGFNKSHSTAYALIAYMTAYLKAHFPVEFMAALLCGDMDGRNFKKKDSLVEHLEDCRRMQIEVVPPDVNGSQPDFTVSEGRIRFGLAAIKGCGWPAARAIAAEARQHGPYSSIYDFCERLDPSVVNKASIESLIKAGAFDSSGARRAQCLAVLEKAMQSGAAALADRRSGQKGLFADEDDAKSPAAAALGLPDIPEWNEKERLTQEKEVLGFYLTSHPLAEHFDTLQTYCTHTSTQLGEVPHKTGVMLGGMLASIKFSHTKNPRPGSTHTKYAMFDLEDMEGIMRCILWPEDFAQFGHLVQPDAILAVRGSVDRRPGSEETNLVVNELIPLAALQERYTKGIRVRVSEEHHSLKTLDQLYEIVRGYPGDCQFELVVCLNDGSRLSFTSGGVKVQLNAEMRQRIDDLLGPGNLRLLSGPVNVNPPNGRQSRKREFAKN
jgi:DNA polymerase-3 subunit alpha